MTVSQVPGGPAAEIRPGGLFSRLLACVVDQVVPVLAITGCVLALQRIPPGSRLSLVVVVLTAMITLGWGVYVWWCGAERAATPGMRLLELEIVDTRTAGQIGWGRFFARSFAFGLLSVTGIGLILMLIFLLLDDNQRGWHDRAGGAVVIARPQAHPTEQTESPIERRPRANMVALPMHLTGATSFQPSGTAGLGTPPQLPQQPAPQDQQPIPQLAAHQVPPQQGPPAGPRPGQFGETPWGDHRLAGASVWQPPQILPRDPQPGSAAPSAASTNSCHSAAEPPDAAEDMTVVRPSSRPAPQPGWQIVLGDGRSIALNPAVVIGRNPDPVPDHSAASVRLDDQTRTVSKNHLLVGVDDRGPYVIDLGSRNGSGIRAAHGGFDRIPPNERIRVGVGAVVGFGEQRLELRRG